MIYRNAEYYPDPTAGEAIRNVMLEQAGIRGKNGEYRKIMEKEYNILCGWGEMTESLVLLAAEDYRKRPGRRRRRLKTSSGTDGFGRRITLNRTT